MKYAFQGFKKSFLDGLEKFNIENATLLDIGCARGECVSYLAETTTVAKVYGVDPGLDTNPMYAGVTLRGEKFQLLSTSAEKTGLPDQSIDIVFSLVVFEHIPYLGKTLNEIYRILKPGGIFVSFWYPLWTCHHGHHFLFWIPEFAPLIEPWGHLLHNQNEMRSHLLEYLHPSSVKFATHYIYESAYLNRRPYMHYINAFDNMPLESIYRKEILTKRPDDTVLNRLPKNLHEGSNVGGFDVVFKRPGQRHDMDIDEIEAFFLDVHKSEPKLQPVTIDNEKILTAIGDVTQKTLIFSRHDAYLTDPNELRSQLTNCTLVEQKIKPGQLVDKFDVAIILQNTGSNFAFTQAISHVIRANRILALCETGTEMDLTPS